jgi:hypothetical protein
MSVAPAGTRLPYTVTYLEMTEAPGTPAPSLPETSRLEHAIDPPVWYFFALYDAVGRDYEWRDKHLEDAGEVRAFVKHKDVELWTLSQNGWPHGFFQLDFRD